MKILLAIFVILIILITPTAVLWWHLFKRMLNGFDVPDGEIEFWEWTERMENDSNSKSPR